ncbi:MAG: Hsp33 family molecular chaperone HslO [Acidobacteriota bacterium]
MSASEISALPPLFEAIDSEADGSLRLGLASGGELRWAVVDLSRPLEALRRRLDPSPLAAMALGRAMSAGALLLRFATKRPGRLRLEVKGDGPLGTISADVDSGGLLRGMADELLVAPPTDGRLDVGAAVGANGLLRVTQELEDRPPYVSQTRLVDGEIGNDLVHFLAQSQQVRSAALLGVVPTSDGIAAAGGLLVEALPGATEAAVDELETAVRAISGVGSTLRDGGADALLEAVVGQLEPEELERHRLLYGCRCERETLLDRLRTLPSADLEEIAGSDRRAELECAFCKGRFLFSVDDLIAN